jgi:hypothetical protein
MKKTNYNIKLVALHQPISPSNHFSTHQKITKEAFSAPVRIPSFSAFAEFGFYSNKKIV